MRVMGVENDLSQERDSLTIDLNSPTALKSGVLPLLFPVPLFFLA